MTKITRKDYDLRPYSQYPPKKGTEFLVLGTIGVVLMFISLFLPYITFLGFHINGISETPIQAIFIICAIIIGAGSLYKYNNAQFKEDLDYSRGLGIGSVVIGAIGIGSYYYAVYSNIGIYSRSFLGVGFYGLILGVGLLGIGLMFIGSNIYLLPSRYVNPQNVPQQTNPGIRKLFCTNCGSKLLSNSLCPNCDTEQLVPTYCDNCGKQFDQNMRFCPHCGEKIHDNPVKSEKDENLTKWITLKLNTVNRIAKFLMFVICFPF